MANQILGVIDAVWKGRKLPLEKGATFEKGGVKNNPIIFGRQTFRSQEGTSAKLTCKVPFRQGDTIASVVGDMTEGELQVVCDTGQVFVVPDAFMTEQPKLTGGDGMSLELVGSEALEMS